MRILLVAGLAALLGGCSRSAPTMAGGKPVSYWVQALQGADAKLRKEAAFKLGNVGTADPAAFPALVEALKDSEPAVRAEAILALMKFGPESRRAIPALTELREHDKNPKVVEYAARALEKLQSSR